MLNMWYEYVYKYMHKILKNNMQIMWSRTVTDSLFFVPHQVFKLMKVN